MPATLDPIFRPRSIAVIGASRQKHAIGWDIVHNLLDYEFQGRVYPVNLKATVVHSLKCYASVEEIPDPVDLAIIVVPRAAVREVIESCGRKGVKGLVIITAGYKEVGEGGAAAEREIVALARRYRMRIIGPNCMGVMNTDPAVGLDASFSSVKPLPGPVAFSSQSGALGEAILALTRELGLGLSMFVSLGNKADVSTNDLLEYWERDERTRVILMYVESFGNPRKFVRVARRVTARKPILAVKSGRTTAGARAAASHTGSLAGADDAVEALLAQCGVIRASTIEELFVYATAFASQPIPRGNRVAIVTNSGGPGILATDACAQLGLDVPVLSSAAQEAIRRVVAPEASVVNPVDMIATAVGPHYEAAVHAAAHDPGIDALIVIFTSLESIDSRKVADGILRGARGIDKPVLVCFMGKVSQRESVEAMKAAGLPVYTFPEEAAHALAALVRYRRWTERAVGTTPTYANFDASRISTVFAGVRADGRAQLTLAEAQQVLDAAGIRVARWTEVRDARAAGRAATEIGWPVVLKVSSAAIVHKSETGGVRLNLGTVGEVEDAAAEMLEAAARVDPRASLVVQAMVQGGTEVIFGASLDPKFGPLMMFGVGGIFVEILKDIAFRVHPITDVDAAEMLTGIRSYPLLTGARGHQAVHLAALKETLLRLNQLLTEFPEIQEFDLNPFMAHPDAAQSVAVDARLTLTSPARPA